MSGALTTGETLTGGTSGATGIVESINNTRFSNNHRYYSKLNPVVVTCVSGHNFKDGQQVEISSVGGMTVEY